MLTDSSTSISPIDAYDSGGVWETYFYAPAANFGPGGFSVNTEGGTSAALPVSPPAEPAEPALDHIVASGRRHPRDPGEASANAGQVITLVGTDLNRSTQVLFAARDIAGTEFIASATPLAVAADGTRLQVQVPDLAQSGTVRVARVGNQQNLGFSVHTDAIHRNVTLGFTAGGTSTQRSLRRRRPAGPGRRVLGHRQRPRLQCRRPALQHRLRGRRRQRVVATRPTTPTRRSSAASRAASTTAAPR